MSGHSRYCNCVYSFALEEIDLSNFHSQYFLPYICKYVPNQCLIPDFYVNGRLCQTPKINFPSPTRCEGADHQRRSERRVDDFLCVLFLGWCDVSKHHLQPFWFCYEHEGSSHSLSFAEEVSHVVLMRAHFLLECVA
jgi:hypothetical protein